MKLIIFDLDGTLLNTIADLGTAANYALQACQYPTHELESYKKRVGNGVNKLLERSLPETDRNTENIQRLRTAFIPYYDTHNTCFTQPYEGIHNLLRHLQAQGKQIAVASNKYQHATQQLITHFFPDIHFAAILGQRENIPVKPDPQIVYDILATTGQEATQTLYIGDSDVDMRTARNANVTSIGVTWGFCRQSSIEQEHPDYLARTATEIEKIIGQIAPI